MCGVNLGAKWCCLPFLVELAAMDDYDAPSMRFGLDNDFDEVRFLSRIKASSTALAHTARSACTHRCPHPKRVLITARFRHTRTRARAHAHFCCQGEFGEDGEFYAAGVKSELLCMSARPCPVFPCHAFLRKFFEAC